MSNVTDLQKRTSKRAFTLIELIIVIAILAILAVILIPTMNGIVSDSKKSVANANARTIYSIAQTKAVLSSTQGTTIADKDYAYTGDAADLQFAKDVAADAGEFVVGSKFTITVAGGKVTKIAFTAADGTVGNYPKS